MPYKFEIVSKDVIHSYNIPDFAVFVGYASAQVELIHYGICSMYQDSILFNVENIADYFITT